MASNSTAIVTQSPQPCWSELIEEALVEVFSRLDFLSLFSASRVCRAWHGATRFPESWDFVHRTLHASFLDSMIKEISPAEDPRIVNAKARSIVTRSRVRATSICVYSDADYLTIHKIADRCPSLESLSLRDCNNIQQGVFYRIFHCCKMLKLVDLSGCNRSVVSAAVLEELGHSCPGLIGLNLGGLKICKKSGLMIGTFMPGLRWLNLKNTNISSNLEVVTVLKMCKELEYLNVKGCYPCDIDHEIVSQASGVADFLWDRPSMNINMDLADNWFSTLY